MEAETIPKRSFKKYVILTISAFLVMPALGFLAYLKWPREYVISKEIVASTPFTIYIPTNNTYKIDPSTIASSDGFITYKVSNGAHEIIVTQQQALAENTSLKIDGFTNVSSPIGTVMIGSVQDVPTAIIPTTNTLITLRGRNSTDKYSLQALALNLKRLD